MEKRIIDPDGRLVALRLGKITLILDRDHEPPAIDRLEGTYIIVMGSQATRDWMAEWISTVEVSDASRQLGIGRGTVGRVRAALGISDTYDGDSITTRWRRRNKGTKVPGDK